MPLLCLGPIRVWLECRDAVRLAMTWPIKGRRVCPPV
jgi:hypothetical protein